MVIFFFFACGYKGGKITMNTALISYKTFEQMQGFKKKFVNQLGFV